MTSMKWIGFAPLIFAIGFTQSATADPETKRIEYYGSVYIWTLKARIKDSAGETLEVWKDQTSGLTWGDAVEGKYTEYEAEKVCESEVSWDSRGHLKNLIWSLPSSDDYYQALKHVMRTGVPKMWDPWYWSSTPSLHDPRGGLQFNGTYGGPIYFGRHIKGSVRCVGREPK